MIKIYPTEKEFQRLAKKGNLLPIYAELLGDLETPVSVFLKVCEDNKYAYLLESVESADKIGRYSFLSTNPSLVFQSKGRDIKITNTKSKSQTKIFTTTNPLDEIRKIQKRFKYVRLKQLPRFCGGFVGFISYDMVRFFEEIPDKNKDDLDLPDCIFMLSEDLIIFDHFEKKILIVTNVNVENKRKIKASYYEAANKIIKTIRLLTSKVKIKSEIPRVNQRSSLQSNFSKDSFCRIIKKAKGYIKRGDIIQVVLSQRFKIKLSQSPIQIYRRLRSINPSPYMYYLKFPEFELVGSSPEMLVRCEDGNIETRPIAGTRPRGSNELEDEKLARQLLSDKKERAEHLMLVDLGRNDLGRVSKKGSVKVDKFMVIEKYSHVMHIVSSVVSRIDPKFDIFDVLASVFPAGTLSGAPKIRAMEIIDELENVRRGPYGGCVGYFSFSGNMDTCITIRTIVIKDGFGYIQAGAGIVADSRPEKEFAETKNKAKALIEAITNSNIF